MRVVCATTKLELDKISKEIEKNQTKINKDEKETLHLIMKEIAEKQNGVKINREDFEKISNLFLKKKGKVDKLIDGDMKMFAVLKQAITSHFATRVNANYSSFDNAIDLVCTSIATERRRVMKAYAPIQYDQLDKQMGYDQSGEGVTVNYRYPGLYTDKGQTNRGVSPIKILGKATESDPIVGFVVGDRVVDGTGDAGVVTAYDGVGFVMVKFDTANQAIPIDLAELKKEK